jgi:hypothetical protein
MSNTTKNTTTDELQAKAKAIAAGTTKTVTTQVINAHSYMVFPAKDASLPQDTTVVLWVVPLAEKTTRVREVSNYDVTRWGIV